ncbi:MAG: thioredoxin family protein [Puniceicoccales bacterium]|jgi:hypothetical protein|nr:thioredoxin family protein [Puniceicoccales bacterium]
MKTNRSHFSSTRAFRALLAAAGVAGAAVFAVAGEARAQNAPAFVPVDADEPPAAPAAPPKPARVVVEFTGDGFDASLAGKTAFVEFYTNAAKPAHTLLEDVLAATPDDVLVGRLNLSFARQKIREHGIKNVPTFIVFQNGVAMSTFVGKRDKSVFIDAINALRGAPPAPSVVQAPPAVVVTQTPQPQPQPPPASVEPLRPLPNPAGDYVYAPEPRRKTSAELQTGADPYATHAPRSTYTPAPAAEVGGTGVEPPAGKTGVFYIRAAGYFGTAINYTDGTRAFNGGGGGVVSIGGESRGESFGTALDLTLTAGARNGSYAGIGTSLTEVNLLLGPRFVFGGVDSPLNFSLGAAIGFSANSADYGAGIPKGNYITGGTVLYRASATVFCGSFDALLSLQVTRHFAFEAGARLLASGKRDLGGDYGGLIIKSGASGQFQIGIRAAF